MQFKVSKAIDLCITRHFVALSHVRVGLETNCLITHQVVKLLEEAALSEKKKA